MNAETSNAISWLVDRGLGAIGLAVIGYFMKYFFDNVHQRLTDVQTANDLKFADIMSRISSMEGKYRDVLDIVLEKFSKWEDRIMGILSKIGTLSQEDINKEITAFKVSAKEDIDTMKLRVERVSVEVKNLVDEPLMLAQRESLLDRMQEIEVNTEARVALAEETINKMVRSLTAMHLKQKEHEFKLTNIISVRKL
jgi:hypothetical protein